MGLRITSAVVAPIIVVAAAAALFRVYTAPERVQKRLQTAKDVCQRAGGEWAIVEGEREPICKR